MPGSLTLEQADALRRLCRWGDDASLDYGRHLAQSLLGSAWERLDAQALVDKPASQRTLAEEIRLLMSLAEALQAPREQEAWCLTLAQACAPHPLLTRQLLTQHAYWDVYRQIPQYDLRWQLVNIGLYRAHVGQDPALFAALLAGVSVADGRSIEIDPSRCAWGASAAVFSVLQQHLVRGLIGLAPDDCEPAVTLRRAVRHLSIDASVDLYKWERDFPVDCLPLARFEALESIEIQHACPLISAELLQRCPRLKQGSFEDCHQPWGEERWSMEALRCAAHGDEVGLRAAVAAATSWQKISYVSLQSGQTVMVMPRGSPFQTLRTPSQPPASAAVDVEGRQGWLLRGLLSADQHAQQQAVAWAIDNPSELADVVDIEVPRWGGAAEHCRLLLPNCALIPRNLGDALLEVFLLRIPEEARHTPEFSMRANPHLTSLQPLRWLTGLRQLSVYDCPQLVSLEGIDAHPALASLVLQRTPRLQTRALLARCSALRNLVLDGGLSEDERSMVGGLCSLQHLTLSGCTADSLQWLQAGLTLRRLSLPSSHLASLSGLEHLELQSPPGKPSSFALSLTDSAQLTTLDALPRGIDRLALNLTRCGALRELPALQAAAGVRRLLLVLKGCERLESLSVLSTLPDLQKLHLNISGLRQHATLLESLTVSAKVQVTLQRREVDYPHF